MTKKELKTKGDIEYGRCEVCGKMGPLRRTYWNYDIKCECHSPNHFEVKWHCPDCVPVEPIETKISFKTANLPKKKENLNKEVS